jgi:protein-S-isoprenylcysteine O-methyltransferase Ste14
MDVSAGFLVVLFVAICLVVMPSALIAMRLWNSGLRGRALLTCGCLLLVLLGIGAFLPDPEFGAESLEDSVVMFMAIWGIVLYFALGLTALLRGILCLGSKAVHLTRQRNVGKSSNHR